MGVRKSIVVCLTLMMAFSTAIEGLDITKVLEQYPEYGKFSKYLTETKLVDQINSLKAVTLFVLDDTAVACLSGKSEETVKAILSTNILVDFYDEKKAVEAIGSKTELENLFQRSGLAKNKQGYVRVNLIGEGGIAFASAVEGSPFDSELVYPKVPEPNVVSILQVTKPILAPGIEQPSSKIAASPSSSHAHAPSPSSSPRIHINFLAVAFAFASLFFLSL